MRLCVSILVLLKVVLSTSATARDYRVPDEYEIAGSSAQAITNSGIALSQGADAVQVNPALLALNKTYSVTAAYFWPTSGREIYKLSVVDSSTSKYAASFTYTGFQGDFQDQLSSGIRDSRVLKRSAFAMAYPFRKFALGASLDYVEGIHIENGLQSTKEGLSLGLGAVALLTQSVRVGIAIQNLNNQETKEFSPRYIKGGVAWNILPETVSVHLDYRNRERISWFEGSYRSNIPGYTPEELRGFRNAEEILSIGGIATVYNLARVSVNYGSSLKKDDTRQSLSGSIGVYQDSYSFVYTVSQPHMKYSEVLKALTLNVAMKI